MAAGEQVKVWVAIDRSPNVIPCSNKCTAEELCILLCKKYNIPPLTRTLFALRIRGTDHFLKDNSRVLASTKEYELRIRFKVPRLGLLITLDETTYDYYFQQARNDINENKIPEIKYPEHKQVLLGLGIVDMARAILEEKITLKDVENNYKKYVPKVILSRHGPYTKKHAHKYVPKVHSIGHNVNTLKNLYLKELYTLAPNYLAETYDNIQWKNGEEFVTVKVVVAPFHPQQPGLRLYNTHKCDWFHICPIEELIYLRRNGDCSLEVSRKGTPMFFTFKNEEQLSSFISVCDGYYRLMVKWTFNLSKDDETPSLKELQRMKCHGPVGGAFSYRKLEEKRSKNHGCYILRECQDDYNVYYLDVCTKNRTTETYRVEYQGRCWLFNEVEYDTFLELVSSHQKPDERIYLKECIPPSEYDKSQLLLCGEPQKKGVRVDQAELQEILKDNKSPRCLPIKDILLYTGSEKPGSDKITATFKALWKLDETKKLLVAFKTLQRERANDYLKDFIDLANKWSCIQSSSIVRLYGITLASPTALVLEYLPHGPFDVYLKNNKDKLKKIHLMKVAASLAHALWDLSEARVVHGDIRCRRLLLAAHDEDRIVVKLSGPTLRQYKPQDVHWMPVEYQSDMNLARRFVLGDIWAFATTLWEVFSYGQSPAEINPVLTAKSYERGERLLRPTHCPLEVYTMMQDCWKSDPLRPQEIMRDMNHLLHAEYVPVNNGYAELIFNHQDPETFSTDGLSNAGSDRTSMSVDSSMPSMNGMTDSDNPSMDNNSTHSFEVASLPSQSNLAGPLDTTEPDDDCANFVPSLMESIVSQGKTYLVTFGKRIGSGNYGHVFKGWMESDNQEFERKEVAIKKLTRHPSDRKGTVYEDFKNELDIMKSLHHSNIVEILGYSMYGPDVMIVMEYLQEGSLYSYLKFQGDKLRTSHLLKYALDVASGMDYISAKNMVHRDLATRNILVVNKNYVKISDFGLARIIPKEENEYKVKTERWLPFNWYAPESAVKPWHFSTKSDVWSYGVTVWEIFTRARKDVPKFDTNRPQERSACFDLPEGCQLEIYRHLMKDCWEIDPVRRPKFIDLVLKCKRFLDELK